MVVVCSPWSWLTVPPPYSRETITFLCYAHSFRDQWESKEEVDFVSGGVASERVLIRSVPDTPPPQLYEVLEERFPYFKASNTNATFKVRVRFPRVTPQTYPPHTHTQNSVRHILTVTDQFLKIARPADDPGPGAYWTIDPKYKDLAMPCERVFLGGTGVPPFVL